MNLPARDPEVLLAYDGFVRALAEGLVSEGQRADDVAQETWMAALEHGPRDRRSLRAWLAAVVRNFASKLESSERRRALREQAVAREEAIPSTHEILEREAVRKSAVHAVVELLEPYRSVVLLRYFEHLPPREIARRLSVPVATVHTRTKRALEQLRRKLDQEHRGDRRAWTSALVPLARLLPSLPVATASVAPVSLLTGGSPLLGVLAMSIQSKVALAVALLACSSVVLWRFSAGPAPDIPSGAQPVDTASAASATRAARQDLARQAVESATSPRRAVATAPAPETRAAEATGSLFVRLLWASDKTPAAHVVARVTPSWRVTPIFDRIYVESGDDGTFRIPSIQAGAVTVRVLRGGGKRVEVEAGKEAEVTVEIPGGFTVTGTVVRPGGQPVGGAEIWLSLSTSLTGLVVAHSAADGSFRLRDVLNPSFIGAIDPGRARSPLVELFDRKGSAARDEIHVRLTLRDAVGALAGRVLDPSGNPVSGAFAVLGKDRNLITKEGGELAMQKDGGVVVAYPVMEAKTDAEGTFSFRALAPGRDQVVIRAKTFAAWTGTVEVSAGSCATLEARLVKGASLTGTVRDSAGKPVEGCEVTAGDGGRTDDPASVIASSMVRSDAQGAFRLEALTPGRIEVTAETTDLGRAKTVLTAADGNEVRWDAVLSGGLELRGRVLDHLGAPLPKWRLHVQSEAPPFPPPSNGHAQTDQEGRFRITNLADLPHRVELGGDGSSFPLDVRFGVRPGSAEVTFRIAAETRATASITGAVVDAEDRPLGDVTVWLYRSPHGRTDVATDPATGRFRFSVPPGCYRLLYVQSKGINPSHRTIPTFFAGERQLASAETWDLGNLRVVPGGTLRVTAKCEAGLEVSKAWLSLAWGVAGECKRWDFNGPATFDGLQFKDGIAHWTQAGGAGDRVLAAGSYQAQVGGDGFASAIHTFAIRTGSETHLDVQLRRGILRTLTIENPAPEPRRIAAQLTVHDSDGKLVLDAASRWFPAGSPSATRRAWFLPGTYRARATMDARAGEVEFRVLPEATGDEPVRIVLE